MREERNTGFAPGDVVQHKDGGQEMVVRNVSGDMVTCISFDAQHRRVLCEYHCSELVHVEP